MVRVSACNEKTWTQFPCLKLSLEFARKISYIFWEFEFFNVAKFPALARLIIRYSVLTLLQNVKMLCYEKIPVHLFRTLLLRLYGLLNTRLKKTSRREKIDAVDFLQILFTDFFFWDRRITVILNFILGFLPARVRKDALSSPGLAGGIMGHHAWWTSLRGHHH